MLLTTDFCDKCKSFDMCVKLPDSKKLVCKKCFSLATNQPESSFFESKIINNKIEKANKLRNNNYSQHVTPVTRKKETYQYTNSKNHNTALKHELKKLFENNPNEVYKFHDIKDMYADYSYEYTYKMLTELVKEEFIFSRFVFIKGQKAFLIYSKDKILINNWLDDESVTKIYNIIKKESPINLSELADLANLSNKQTSIIIRKKLSNKVEVWKCQNKYWYVLKDDENRHEKLKKTLVYGYAKVIPRMPP